MKLDVNVTLWYFRFLKFRWTSDQTIILGIFHCIRLWSLFCNSTLSFTDQNTETLFCLFFTDKNSHFSSSFNRANHQNPKLQNETGANETETGDTHRQRLNVSVSAVFIPLFVSELFYSVFTLIVFTNTDSLRFHSALSARVVCIGHERGESPAHLRWRNMIW